MKVFKAWLSVIVVLLLCGAALTGCGGSGAATAPAVPTAVSATAGDGYASINWTAALNAASYNIYYSTIPAQATKAEGNKVTGVAAPYVVSGLTDGNTYYFVVTSVNSVGESAESAQATCTLALRPEGVAATPASGLASISWLPVSNATSYNVYWSTTPGVSPANGKEIVGAATTSSSPTGPLTFQQTGLTNGTTYYYVVTFVDAKGESAPSAQVSALPAVAPPPLAPTGVQATPGNGQVAISWGAVTGADSYNIYWSNDAGRANKASGTRIAGIKGTSPTVSYLQTGLNNGIGYYYVVTSVSANGESLIASDQVTAIPSF